MARAWRIRSHQPNLVDIVVDLAIEAIDWKENRNTLIFLLGIVFVYSSSSACSNPLIDHSTVTTSLIRFARLIPRVFSLEDTDASYRFGSYKSIDS